MAGIGFLLRELTRRDNLLGLTQAYVHSALVATGPWLFTVVSIGAIVLLGSEFLPPQDTETFRLIVIYNFAFSLVLSGPVMMVVTRYLADLIYAKNPEEAPGVMLGGLGLLYVTQLLIVAPFYFFYVNLEPALRLAAFANFFLVAGIWLITVFLTALKDFTFITRAFFVGMLSGIGITALLAQHYSVLGMLIGFSAGLAIILFSMIAKTFSEFPYRVIRPLRFLTYFKTYWDIALSGLVYNLAIWVDKWIMWFSPERIVSWTGMIHYPDYDSAMFLAYLTIVPSMAVFMVSIETRFYEQYQKFSRDIQRHATYAQIQENHRNVMQIIHDSFRNFVILQGSLGIVLLFTAPKIFQWLGINFLQLSMFRVGIAGALFHFLFLYLTIILQYFDFRRVVLILQLVFLIANATLTMVSMKMGFVLYGFGYLLSCLLTFCVTYIVADHFLRQLPYETFVRHNPSIQ
ncbi:MAG: exopolysaccharide Pel transporter PelG [Candidatus Binatia bacterium]